MGKVAYVVFAYSLFDYLFILCGMRDTVNEALENQQVAGMAKLGVQVRPLIGQLFKEDE